MGEIQLRKNTSIIFIAGRGFGDAIMLKYVIEKIKEVRSDLIIDVLCEPCLKSIFVDNELINQLYTANISISRRTWKIGGLIKHILSLRNKYDVGMEIIGDFRERFLLKILSPKCIYGVVREKNNLYKGFYDFGQYMITPINIPSTIFNFYDTMDYFVAQVLGKEVKKDDKGCEINKINRIPNGGKMILGIHPFSGIPCKMWQWEKWNALCNYFLKKNVQIKIFCAPSEENIVKKQLNMSDDVEIVSGSIKEFKERLKQVDCLVCLDSFSMHMAYMLRVPHVMINGANDYRLWQTRLTKTISTGNESCNRWPCWGGHGCNDYKCIKNSGVNEVIENINSIMRV